MHPIEPAASFSFAATACNKIPRGEIQLTVSTLSQVRHASASAGPTSSTEVNEEPSQAGRATDAVIQRAKGLAEPYVAERATETLFKECARQADYIVPQAFEKKVAIPTNEAGEHIGEGTGWWYEKLGLVPTFNSWAQVTFLHMYLLVVRMRYFSDKNAKLWLQLLTDQFFYEAEHRMTTFHAMSSSAIRSKNLKDLYNQWRGVQGAYDEGLIRGDAVLGTAVWRNVFKAKDDADWRHVALVVGFMRRGLRALDRAHDSTLVAGLIRFGSPMSEMSITLRPSDGMKRPFTAEDEQDIRKVLEVEGTKK